VKLPVRSCTPLAFGVSSRTSECFGRINMRSFLSSPLVVVGKGIELTRNRSVGHGLGSAEQSPCCLKIFLTSLQPHARPSRPVCMLLNNQATDRLTGSFEAGMTVWPWFLPESQSRCGQRRPRARGRSKDPEPCARRDRPRSRADLVQHFRFLLCGTSAAVVIAAR